MKTEKLSVIHEDHRLKTIMDYEHFTKTTISSYSHALFESALGLNARWHYIILTKEIPS